MPVAVIRDKNQAVKRLSYHFQKALMHQLRKLEFIDVVLMARRVDRDTAVHLFEGPRGRGFFVLIIRCSELCNDRRNRLLSFRYVQDIVWIFWFDAFWRRDALSAILKQLLHIRLNCH
jgi:hypothetical protein